MSLSPPGVNLLLLAVFAAVLLVALAVMLRLLPSMKTQLLKFTVCTALMVQLARTPEHPKSF